MLSKLSKSYYYIGIIIHLGYSTVFLKKYYPDYLKPYN